MRSCRGASSPIPRNGSRRRRSWRRRSTGSTTKGHPDTACQARRRPAPVRGRRHPRRRCCLRNTGGLRAGRRVPEQHEPVSVLIADFQNTSNDSTFDRTLEPILKLALESAGFISAYDRGGMRNARCEAARDAWTNVPPRRSQPKQGLSVVLSGSVARAGKRLRDRGQGDASGDGQRARGQEQESVRARIRLECRHQAGD